MQSNLTRLPARLLGLLLAVSSTQAATYWASPSGKSGVAGTEAAPLDLSSALNKLVPGDSLLLKSGNYAIAYTANAKNTLVLDAVATQTKPITVITPAGRAIWDFGFPEQAWVQDSYGILLSGSWWHLERVEIVRAGYQGAYVTGAHNSFENCAFHHNRNTGLEINKGGSYTSVRHCDAYRNYDPKKGGSMADGFGPKQTQGPGNTFVGCRSWENSDDGFDLFDSPEVVTLDSCWAFRNGVDVWKYTTPTFSGNGNGFKIGGNFKAASHVVRHSVAFDQPARGFDQNNNTGGLVIENCTAWRNVSNFGLASTTLASGQSHHLRNNLAFEGPNDIKNATEDHNSWNLGKTAKSGDFLSLDTILATRPRLADGSLAATDLLRLSATSSMVDAGIDIGLGFFGKAPDLGAFERGTSPSGISSIPCAPVQSARWNHGRIELSLESNHGEMVRIHVIGVSGQMLSPPSRWNLVSGSNPLHLEAGFERRAWVVIERQGMPMERLDLLGI